LLKVTPFVLMPPPPVRLRVDVPALKVTEGLLEKLIAGLPLRVTVLLPKFIVRALVLPEVILFPVTEKFAVVKVPAVTSISPVPVPVPKVKAPPRVTVPPGALTVNPPPMVLPAVVSVAVAVIDNLPVYV
jgi:hypothetical protein